MRGVGFEPTRFPTADQVCPEAEIRIKVVLRYHYKVT